MCVCVGARGLGSDYWLWEGEERNPPKKGGGGGSGVFVAGGGAGKEALFAKRSLLVGSALAILSKGVG